MYGFKILSEISKGTFEISQNFEPIHHKICILRGVKNLTTYDILELWHLKSWWDGPQYILHLSCYMRSTATSHWHKMALTFNATWGQLWHPFDPGQPWPVLPRKVNSTNPMEPGWPWPISSLNVNSSMPIDPGWPRPLTLHKVNCNIRANSRFTPSQWETL